MNFGLDIFERLSVIETFIILCIAVWSIVWKGFALWISAKEGKKWWFIPILIFNTMGILEIIYILFFSLGGRKIIFAIQTKIKKRRKLNKTNIKKEKFISDEK